MAHPYVGRCREKKAYFKIPYVLNCTESVGFTCEMSHVYFDVFMPKDRKKWKIVRGKKIKVKIKIKGERIGKKEGPGYSTRGK